MLLERHRHTLAMVLLQLGLDVLFLIILVPAHGWMIELDDLARIFMLLQCLLLSLYLQLLLPFFSLHLQLQLRHLWAD